MNSPSFAMDPAESFIGHVDDMLHTLGLPPAWGIEEIDDLDAFEEELSDLQLIFCFPNLTSAERDLIGYAARVNRRIRFLGNILSAQEVQHSAKLRQKSEDALSSARTSRQEAIDSVEQYGVRAKLTEFQEQLLERFLHGKTSTI